MISKYWAGNRHWQTLYVPLNHAAKYVFFYSGVFFYSKAYHIKLSDEYVDHCFLTRRSAWWGWCDRHVSLWSTGGMITGSRSLKLRTFA